MKIENWRKWLSPFSSVGDADVVEACATGGEPTDDAPPVDEAIQLMLDSLDAHTTFYAKHLPTGREIAIRADTPVNALSTIKIPIMILAYRDAEAGHLDLDARYPVRPEVRIPGRGDQGKTSSRFVG